MAIDDDSVTPGELPAIAENAVWQEHLPALLTGVKVRGGDAGEGAANFQARALDARTRFLKAALDSIQADGTGVTLIGVLETQEELDAIPTAGLKTGTAYFLNFEMRVWNGTEWATSGSLRGERGLNLLGAWPNQVPLPEYTENQIGDAYLWQNDIWVLVPYFNMDTPDPEHPPVWEGLGIRGPDGKSTFELWQSIPGNENKTLQQFMDAQKGEKGDDAYQTWLKIPENDGKSMAQWVEETRGIQGIQGDPRAPFTVAGGKATVGDLPTPGDESKAWYVGIDLYVWVEADQNYFMVPGIAGKSAYQIWLENPEHEGQTEAQFIASLKSTVPGPKGDPGDDGADGRNLRIIGTVGTSTDLNAIQDPVDQDAYATMDTGRLWMYLPAEGGWKDLGPWRGVDGKSAFEVWQADGHPDGTLQQFWASLKGADGINMQIRGVVANLADLPASPEEQWIYAVTEDRQFYLYLDGAWVALGTYGKDGEDGLPGADGKSLDIIKILTEEDQVAPPADASTKGKAYISYNPRDVYVNVSGAAWQNAGPFIAQGEQGPQGVNWRPKGTVQRLIDLPNIGDPQQGYAQEGDTYSVIDEGKKLYTVVDGQWSGPVDIVGPQGIQGIQGNPGALMPILGMYPTLAALKAAHPTGSLGDAYLIIDEGNGIRNLAIWSVEANDWIDTGPAGVPGAQGPAGADSTVPGPKGDKGSQWLTLDTHDAPSVTFNGRAGDWAVNRDNKIWYKTVNQGWIYWGTLVAGDVDSPLLSEGKVVRLGNQWVPLRVDEVETGEEGKYYARVLTGEDAGQQTFDWAALPKIIDDLTNKDGKQYVRVFAVGGTVPVWAEIDLSGAGIQDIANPEDGALYLRLAKTKSWVKYVPAPSDGNVYVQKDGNWLAFDRYDLKIKAVNATYTINPLVEQFVKLDNSGSTAKTISLNNGPAAGRGMVVVLEVVGVAGVISYGGTNIKWADNTIPSLTGTKNLITFTWDGEVWIGAKGPGLTT